MPSWKTHQASSSLPSPTRICLSTPRPWSCCCPGLSLARLLLFAQACHRCIQRRVNVVITCHRCDVQVQRGSSSAVSACARRASASLLAASKSTCNSSAAPSRAEDPRTRRTRRSGLTTKRGLGNKKGMALASHQKLIPTATAVPPVLCAVPMANHKYKQKTVSIQIKGPTKSPLFWRSIRSKARSANCSFCKAICSDSCKPWILSQEAHAILGIKSYGL